MSNIKRKFALISIIVIVILIILALITGNFHIGKQVDKGEILDAIQLTYNSNEMEYDYTFKGRIAYKFAGIFGPWADAETSGSVKWNNDETLDSNFLVYRESKGLLLFDTIEYIYNIGDSVFVEKIDEDFDLTFKTSSGDFDSTYTFETDIFGDILRDVNSSDISSVTYYENLGIYNVKFSDGIKGAFANQMSNIAQTAFSEDGSSSLVSLSMDCEITLRNGYIDTFMFSISLDITDVELSFEFNQTFVSFTDIDINVPHHDNVIIGDDLIEIMEVLSNSLSDFFGSSYSNYSFDFRNQIDAGVFSFSLGTDLRGTHVVKELDGIYYFNNYYELDSDYKPELPDKKQSIALLNNDTKDCWLEIFNLMFNDYELLETYDSGYEVQYTNLNYDSLIDNLEFLVIDDTQEDVIYKLGVEGDTVLVLFDLLNESIEYDAYKFNDSLDIGVLEISLVLDSENNIIEINIFAEGKYIDTFDLKQNFTIKLDFLTSGVGIDDYEIPTSKEDVN